MIGELAVATGEASTSASARPLVFVIPAYNEEENLPRLLVDLEARPELLRRDTRLLIVDDGSSDGTTDLLDG